MTPAGGRRHTTVLVAIVLAGAAVRYWGLNFGLPHTQARPDESRIINLAIGIANGDLNPHYFVYPTLYMYLLAGVLRVQALVAGVQDVSLLPQAHLFLTGRGLTAAFGTGTIWIVYALGTRLRDRLTGLVAAGLLAFAFLHVRDSHFATTDVPMACGVVLSVLFLLAPDAPARSVAVAGVVAGLATSLKYNAGLVAAVLLFLETYAVCTRATRWRAALRRCALFAALMTAGFLLGTPFAILDRSAFLAGIEFVVGYMGSGHAHGGQMLAVSNAAWRYLSFVLPAGVGWPMYVLSLPGLLVLARRNPRTGVACLLFPVLYFLIASSGKTVFARYMIPIVPFLCIGAAYTIRVGVESLRDRRRPAVAAALAALVVLPAAIATVRLDVLLSRRDSRLIAATWIETHIGSSRSIWESGSMYGRLQYFASARDNEWDYDEGRRAFTSEGRTVEGFPDYILIQRSPLTLYSRVPDSAAQLLDSRYMLLQPFKTGLTSLRENDYDASDAFFLPLVHLDRIRRPGPEFDLYELRRDDRDGRD